MNNTAILERENKELKAQQAESVSLFKQLQKQVGTHYGEQIDEHLAALEGRRHNAKAWDLADRNGEQ